MLNYMCTYTYIFTYILYIHPDCTHTYMHAFRESEGCVCCCVCWNSFLLYSSARRTLPPETRSLPPPCSPPPQSISILHLLHSQIKDKYLSLPLYFSLPLPLSLFLSLPFCISLFISLAFSFSYALSLCISLLFFLPHSDCSYTFSLCMSQSPYLSLFLPPAEIKWFIKVTSLREACSCAVEELHLPCQSRVSGA